MSVQNIARAYLDGYYPQTHGLTLNDAVHVLATEYGVHKADLRVAITSAEEIPVSPQPVDGSTVAVVEGEDADVLEDFIRNYP